MSRLRRGLILARVFALLVLAAIGTGWSADGAMALIDSIFVWPGRGDLPAGLVGWMTSAAWTSQTLPALLWTLSGVVLLVGSLFGLFRMRHRIVHYRVQTHEDRSYDGSATLVLGLSIARGDPPDALTSLPLHVIAMTAADHQRSVALPDGTADAEALAAINKHPWQQGLRALYAHLHNHLSVPLRQVVIVPSFQSSGNAVAFKRIVEHHVAGRQPTVDVHVHPVEGADYDDLPGLIRVFENISTGKIRNITLIQDSGNKISKTCIDITAGVKIFSAAASIATINEDIVFSYVNNEGSFSVRDVRVDFLENLAR